MPFAIFFLVFGGAIILAILYPHIRVLALATAALCAVLVGTIFVDRVAETDRRALRLTPQDITLSDVTLVPEARYFKLTGWAENKSALHRARDFILRSRLYDCPTDDAALTDCTTVGDETGIARVDLPPGQARPFSAVLGFTAEYEARGVLHWEHEITEVHATDDVAR